MSADPGQASTKSSASIPLATRRCKFVELIEIEVRKRWNVFGLMLRGCESCVGLFDFVVSDDYRGLAHSCVSDALPCTFEASVQLVASSSCFLDAVVFSATSTHTLPHSAATSSGTRRLKCHHSPRCFRWRFFTLHRPTCLSPPVAVCRTECGTKEVRTSCVFNDFSELGVCW